MKIELTVLRRDRGAAEPYEQTFLYETDDEAETVATALTKLNAQTDLRDVNGAPAAPIEWECSCLQKKCGACAMVINGRPGLACDARLAAYKKRIRLEPLRKFPVVADLIVDRGSMFESLEEMKLWFTEEASVRERTSDEAYEASRCLQCGCCLEVCLNFMPGGRFTGMAAGVPMTRILTELPDARRSELAKLYRERVFEGCGKSLACRNVCPANIDIDRMLVNSNAIAVWKRLIR